MVGLAQLVRASACGAEGCRFKSGISPQDSVLTIYFYELLLPYN